MKTQLQYLKSAFFFNNEIWKKALERLGILFCQQMFVKWKTLKEKSLGRRGEAGQENSQSVILRWRQMLGFSAH